MASIQYRHTASSEQFDRLVDRTDLKLEYVDNQIFVRNTRRVLRTFEIHDLLGSRQARQELLNALLDELKMATREHSFITRNLMMYLAPLLDDGQYLVYNDGAEIQIGANYYMPDAVVTEAENERVSDKRRILNPIAIFEVLSPSTEEYDRSDKKAAYQSLPSLQDYVLIAQDEPYILHHFRNANNEWDAREYRSDTERIDFAQLPIELTATQVYRGVKF